MNTKKRISIVVLTIALLAGFLGFTVLCVGDAKDYYTKVDNAWVVETTPGDNLRYRYTLTAYDANAKEKSVTFKTGRILKDGAYLHLKVLPIRGVVSWAEEDFQKLPEAVQAQYAH